jgi:hypothetical protein
MKIKRIICYINLIRLNWHRPFAIPVDGCSYVVTFHNIRNGREEEELTCEVCGKKSIGFY